MRRSVSGIADETYESDPKRKEHDMHFKLIIAFLEDSKTDTVLEAAREAGATGSTLISQARG